MPKQIAQKELDAIVDIVAKFPNGVSLGKIIECLKFLFHGVTSKHRLAFLVKNHL